MRNSPFGTRGIGFGSGLCGLLLALAALASGARAQSAPAQPAPATPAAQPATTPTDGGFLKKVNDIYAGRDRVSPDSLRAELVLLPALAAMENPPAWLTPLNAALITPASKGWAEADAWAASDKHRAALDALKAVTEPGKRFVFNQGYGRDAADPAVRATGLYTEVGEPAILAAAKFNYLPALDRLGALVHVEATRMGEAKQGKEAADLLVRWVQLGRMITDREFAAEKRWGAQAMIMGFERLRDVTRQYAPLMSDADLRTIIERIDVKVVSSERVQLPQGDRLAAEQVVALGFAERAGPKAETFGPIMARVSSTGRPLAQFGEAARWQAGAPAHASTFEMIDAIKASVNDWQHRWSLPYFDPLQQRPTDYSKLDKSKYQALEATLGGVPALFALRQRVLVEAAGTRMSLGVVAFHRRNNKWPIDINAVRPTYVRTTDADPFDPKGADFHYFVPIRDQPRGERDLPKPHEIAVGGAVMPGTEQTEAKEPEKATPESVRALLNRAHANPVIASIRPPDPNSPDKEAWRAAAKEAMTKAYGPTIAEYVTSPAWMQALAAKLSGRPPESPAEGVRTATDTLVSELQRLNKLDAAFNELREAVEALAPRTATASSLGGIPTFTVALDDSTFVIYSVGSNQTREWARSVGQDGTDILLWPSMLSLVRDSLQKQSVDPMTLPARWIDYEPSNAPPPPPPAPGAGKPGTNESGGSSPSSPPSRRPTLPGGLRL